MADKKQTAAHPHAKHRERVRNLFLQSGLEGFSDHNVLELLLFSVLSVLFLLGCRRLMPDVFRGSMKVDPSDIENDDVAGAEAVVVEAISADKPGKVEFRGALWTARADRELAVGERVKISRRQNLTLFIE